MTATYAAEHLKARSERRLVDHDPDVNTKAEVDLDPTAAAKYLPVALYRRFLAGLMHSVGTRLVCVLPAEFRGAERGPVLIPGDVGRGRRRPWHPVWRPDRHRRWLWCADEPELPAGRDGERQSDSGDVRAVPLLRVARLWLDWPGSLATSRAGAAMEARRDLPPIRNQKRGSSAVAVWRGARHFPARWWRENLGYVRGNVVRPKGLEPPTA